MNKHLITIFVIILLFIPTAHAAKRFRISKDIDYGYYFSNLFDLNVSGEFRFKDNLSLGLGLMRREYGYTYTNYNLVGYHVYGRYYFPLKWIGNKKIRRKFGLRHGAFAGLGAMRIDYTWETTSSASASASGATGEGGYQFMMRNFSVEVGYRLWFSGDEISATGSTDNLVIGGGFAKLGYNF